MLGSLSLKFTLPFFFLQCAEYCRISWCGGGQFDAVIRWPKHRVLRHNRQHEQRASRDLWPGARPSQSVHLRWSLQFQVPKSMSCFWPLFIPFVQNIWHSSKMVAQVLDFYYILMEIWRSLCEIKVDVDFVQKMYKYFQKEELTVQGFPKKLLMFDKCIFCFPPSWTLRWLCQVRKY